MTSGPGIAQRPDREGPATPQAVRGPGPGRGRTWLAAVAVLVLMAVAGITFVLRAQHSSGSATGQPGGPGSGRTVLAGLSSAAGVRMATARWIVREVDPSAIIGCDTVMCAALEKAGRPASDLLMIRPSAPDPLGVDVIVATPVLRSQFGGRLRSEYAPAVLARFGRGPVEVDVRVVAPDGAAAYDVAFGRDLVARKRYGAVLAGNTQIVMSQRAKAELAAGDVDPRLLLTLPAMAAQHPIQILSFFDQAPRSGPGVPLSGVRLAGAVRQAGLPAGAYQRWLVSFLRGQQASFRPLSVSTGRHDGHPVVAVRYPRPSPVGLLRP